MSTSHELRWSGSLADQHAENGRKKGTATLVHCRVGVSRSATICIAEVMNELGMSFPRAYCFVRARRLNVILVATTRNLLPSGLGLIPISCRNGRKSTRGRGQREGSARSARSDQQLVNAGYCNLKWSSVRRFRRASCLVNVDSRKHGRHPASAVLLGCGDPPGLYRTRRIGPDCGDRLSAEV